MKPERARDYVILLDDLNFQMSKNELKYITDLHNAGMEFEEIAKKLKRDPYEIILALLHRVKNGANIRPIAYRVKKAKEISKGSQFNAVVDVKKVKKEAPTVIEIEGRRYVYEPESQRK